MAVLIYIFLFVSVVKCEKYREVDLDQYRSISEMLNQSWYINTGFELSLFPY